MKFGRGSGVAGKSVEIGAGSVIGAGSFVRGRQIRLGRRVIIGEGTVIKTQRVEIGDGARVTSRVRVGGFEHPDSAFIMGRNSILMYDSYVDTSRAVHIGEDAGVGGYCLLFTHAAWLSGFEGYPIEFADIKIGDGAWLPWRVTMLPGSNVGAGAVVGTHSVVRSSIPDGCLAVGTPARVIRGPGAFRRPPRQDRVSLLGRVMEDFAQCVQLHGIKVRKDGPIWEFVTPRKGLRRTRSQVAFISHEGTLLIPNVAVDLFISLDCLSPEVRQKLDERMISWLDLETRNRSGALTTLGYAFVDFVVRFGVRFTVVDPKSPISSHSQ